MIAVQFPEPQFKIQTKNGKRFVFDAIRKTWLLLTEEEWVRQNVVAYFIQVLHYPKEAIALEKEILVNGLKKRFDILVYNKQSAPWMLVECKAPKIRLDEDVLWQAMRYGLSVPASYIMITNGALTSLWEKTAEAMEACDSFPAWPGLHSSKIITNEEAPE